MRVKMKLLRRVELEEGVRGGDKSGALVSNQGLIFGVGC